MLAIQLRHLALALLDDEEGINELAWNRLRNLLLEYHQEDIVEEVVGNNNRYYLEDAFEDC